MLIVTTNTLAEIETKREKIKRCVIPGTGVSKVRRRGFFSLRIIASMLLLPNAASTHCCCRSLLLLLGAVVARCCNLVICCCRSVLVSCHHAAVARCCCRSPEPRSSFLHLLPCSILPQMASRTHPGALQLSPSHQDAS